MCVHVAFVRFAVCVRSNILDKIAVSKSILYYMDFGQPHVARVLYALSPSVQVILSRRLHIKCLFHRRVDRYFSRFSYLLSVRVLVGLFLSAAGLLLDKNYSFVWHFFLSLFLWCVCARQAANFCIQIYKAFRCEKEIEEINIYCRRHNTSGNECAHAHSPLCPPHMQERGEKAKRNI